MTEKKAITARYISKYLELGIVRKASYYKEVDGRVVPVLGEKVKFHQGVFETSDPEIMAFLEARPEFGNIFIRVPDNVDAIVHRDEKFKDLDTREKELAEREAEIARKEALLNASEEGARTPENAKDNGAQGEAGDGLEDLNKAGLLEVAEKEGVEDWEAFKRPGVSLDSIREAIRAKRASAPADAPAY